MLVETPLSQSGLVARVKNIILSPKREWPVIAAETATVKSVIVPYAVLLTALGPLAGLIGGQLFPIRVLGAVYRPDLLPAMVQALLGWGLAILGVFLVALIIDGLASSFDGTRDRVQATKVAVYSMTPAWVAGVLTILPTLAPLAALLGLYGFYLLYLGLPALMASPQDKSFVYTVVVALISVALWVVISMVVGSLAMAGTLASGLALGV